MCQGESAMTRKGRMVMARIITAGIDLAENVFQAHGVDGTGRTGLRKKMQPTRILAFAVNFCDACSRWKRVAALVSGASISASCATSFN